MDLEVNLMSIQHFVPSLALISTDRSIHHAEEPWTDCYLKRAYAEWAVIYGAVLNEGVSRTYPCQ